MPKEEEEKKVTIKRSFWCCHGVLDVIGPCADALIGGLLSIFSL
jgi:hypothetical protein